MKPDHIHASNINPLNLWFTSGIILKKRSFWLWKAMSTHQKDYICPKNLAQYDVWSRLFENMIPSSVFVQQFGCLSFLKRSLPFHDDTWTVWQYQQDFAVTFSWDWSSWIAVIYQVRVQECFDIKLMHDVLFSFTVICSINSNEK